MIVDTLKYQVLKEGQKQAFLSYSTIFKKGVLDVQACAKTLSAMANAVGGRIYIGLQLERGKIKGIEPVPEGFPATEVLHSVLQSCLMPEVPNINILQEDSLLLIDVPESTLKPHMFSNYRYYQRAKAKNVTLEEFEIRQLYQSLHQSDVQIVGFTNLQGIPNMESGKFSSMKFYPRVHVQNVGQKTETLFKLEIKIPSDLVDENFESLYKYLKGYENNCNIYSIPSTEPIFQGESRIMIELVLKLNETNYTVFENEKLTFKLFSSEKVYTRELLCSEWFHYKGKLPLRNDFKRLNA